MTLIFLKQHFQNVNIKHSAAWGPFLFFGAITAVLITLALNGFIVKSAIDIIGENRAPKTFELFLSITALFLFGRIAFYGTVGEINSRPFRFLGIWLPNFVLGIGGALTAIMFGAAFSAFVTNTKLPNDLVWSTVIVNFIESVALLIFVYLVFALSLVSPNTAPVYRSSVFQRNYRFGALLMFAIIFFRTLFLLSAWQREGGAA